MTTRGEWKSVNKAAVAGKTLRLITIAFSNKF